MSPSHDENLSMRERQIMDAVYRLEQATVAEIHEVLPEPPTLNAVRTMLGLLTAKGLLRKTFRGRAAVYRPVMSKDRARREALQRVLDIFHRGSLASALAVHLSDPRARLSDQEIDELKQLLSAHEQGTQRGDRA